MHCHRNSGVYQALKTFARRDARKYESASLARTYVVLERPNDTRIAYITLACSEVTSNDKLVQGDGLHFPFDTYPAIKIARLLVDERYRGNGHSIGRRLVNFAQGVAREDICPAVGCRFVVVDAKQESIGFYEKCGFTLIDTAENRQRPAPVMYLDLHRSR